MAKAYDRVEWIFLEKIMLRMGFYEHWVDLKMACITTVSLTILHNGRELGSLMPMRGLR